MAVLRLFKDNNIIEETSPVRSVPSANRWLPAPFHSAGFFDFRVWGMDFFGSFSGYLNLPSS